MRKRNVLNSPRLLELKNKKRKILAFKISLYLFAFIAIFVGLAYFSRISALNIKGVEIVSDGSLNAEMIKTTAENELAGDYLWFFPKTNVFFYPKNGIKKVLFSKFKGIKDLSFKLENSRILSITLKARESKYLWCGLSPVRAGGTQAGENLPTLEVKPENMPCSLVDVNGYVFDPAPYISGDVYFKFFGSLTGDYFSPEIFDKVINFKNALIEMNLKPVSLYTANEDIEIYLSSKILPPNSPKIKLKKDFDLQKISENLQTALDTEPLKSDLKNKFSSLEYIDLRFGNKVYYKFSTPSGK